VLSGWRADGRRRTLCTMAPKRPRPDDGTEALVAAVLREEAAAKAAKKGAPPLRAAGQTLAEVEDADGGPVRESAAAMASHRRAAARRAAEKVKGVADADLGELEDAEEGAPDAPRPDDTDSAVPLEPFNMAAEREEGGVDADGNLVRARRGADADSDGDDGAAADAWLDGAGLASAKGAAAAAAAAAKAAAAAAAPTLGPAEVLALRRRVAASLLPGETVAGALRRLRPERRGDAAAFDALTEAAGALVSAGDGDVFSETRASLAPTGGGGDGDEEGDMFGGSDGEETGGEAAAAPPPPSGPPPAPPAPPRAPTDFTTWPVKELARYVREAGAGGRAGAVERGDLVAAAAAAEAAAAASRAAAAECAPPPGYDRVVSGAWWWSPSAGLWWHPPTGLFGARNGGAWWAWDAGAGAFVSVDG